MRVKNNLFSILSIYILVTPTLLINAQCWNSISGSSSHSLAIKIKGTLWAWGENNDGKLGDGTYINKNFPVQIGNDTDWLKISAGSFHSAAIKQDGSLWTWGSNKFGQLGDSTFKDRNKPVQIGAGFKWKEISSGGYHTLAIREDGSLWAWGSNMENGNFYGQVGNGIIGNFNYPILIDSNTNWSTISAGWHYSQALKLDGSRWGWGAGSYLGNNTISNYYIPTKMDDGNKWKYIYSGYSHIFCIDTENVLWAAGINNDAKLGNGNTNFQIKLIKIGSDIDWVNTQAGVYHSLSLKKDGTLWAWGSNDFGQLGNGSTTGVYLPSQIGTENDWIYLEAGHIHTLALKKDSSLWAWGYNMEGEIGNHGNQNVLSPIKIPCLPDDILGLHETNTQISINLFPQPVGNEIHIDYPTNFTPKIYKIYSYDFNLISNNVFPSNAIHVENLETGLYLLEVDFENNSKVYLKFVKI